MSDTQKDPDIRPSPEQLRAMPTLEVETTETDHDATGDFARELGIDFRLELKLVTDRFKYWLCTKGREEPDEHCMAVWNVGWVTMEARVPIGDPMDGLTLLGVTFGDGDTFSYGPEQAKKFQEFDYIDKLSRRRDDLLESDHQSPSWETKKEIDAIEAEIARLSGPVQVKITPLDDDGEPSPT